MKSLLVSAVILSMPAASLSGCAYSSAQQQEASACSIVGPKSLVGGAAGAAGGAVIGAAAGGGRGAAIGAGVGLLAGLIAGHVADQQDCAAAQAALQAQLFAVQANSRIGWQSQSGHAGQYVAMGDTYQVSGGTCRRAESVPNPGQAAQMVTVCRLPNGDYQYTNA